jgi:uncharacterized membrane protein
MQDPTIAIILRLIHILAGIFWVGVAFLMAGFLLPSVREMGPEGGRFMEVLMVRRRLPIYLGAAMLLTVLSGFIMYGSLASSSHGAWAGSAPGIAYGIGGLAAILGAAVGAGVGSSAGRRMVALRQRFAEAGRPTPEQQAELQRLQARMMLGARLMAGLLAIAAGTMAIGRYV